MKPSEINCIDKHTRYAAERLRTLFRPNTKYIAPEVEKLVRLKESKKMVWRFVWTITEDFMTSKSILGMSTPAAYSDVKYERKYVMDIYEDRTMIDYIVEKDQA